MAGEVGGPSSRRVAVVVDPAFGDRLVDLCNTVHVWACESPANRKAAEAHWRAKGRNHSLDRGVTTFDLATDDPPGDALIEVMGMVDLHHPAWTTLIVYGAQATPELRTALAEYDIATFAETPGSFECTRPPAPLRK
jgi:hypothetical protein